MPELREVFEMTTKHTEPDLDAWQEQERRHRARSRNRRIGSLAVVAAIGLAAVWLVLANRSQPLTSVPADEPSAPTPVEIAEAYIEARNAYDPERARELVSDDFRTNEEPPGFVDITGMELGLEVWETWGNQYSEVNCSFSGETSEGAAVACDYVWTNQLQRIGDHPPTPERLTFTIEDGRIQRIIRSGGEVRSWWRPFRDSFLLSEHPEFGSVVDRSLNLDPESVREVVELLPQYLELYEEWLTSRNG